MKTYKERFYPNSQQTVELNQLLKIHCELYNAALQERIDAYSKKKINISYFDQCKSLTICREENDLLRNYSANCQRQTLRRLDKAFVAFFKRVKRKEKEAGFPRYKSKNNFDTIEFKYGDGISLSKSKKLKIYGIEKEIKIKWHRELPCNPEYVRVTRKNNKWYVCFVCKEIKKDKIVNPTNPIGLDVGLTKLIALSDGNFIDPPKYFTKAQQKLRKKQRAVSRCKRNSNRQKKRKKQVTLYHEHIANQRKDFNHKLTADLINTYDGFAIEDLKIKNMIKNPNLSKQIQDASWSQIFSFLTYKAENAGLQCVKVDPKYTSQTCSSCGNKHEDNRLSQQLFKCLLCGMEINADTNAAINILNKSRLGSSRTSISGGAKKLFDVEINTENVF